MDNQLDHCFSDKNDIHECLTENEDAKVSHSCEYSDTSFGECIIQNHCYGNSSGPETDFMEYTSDMEPPTNINHTHFPFENSVHISAEDIFYLFTPKGRNETIREFFEEVSKDDLGKDKENLLSCLKDIINSFDSTLDVDTLGDEMIMEDSPEELKDKNEVRKEDKNEVKMENDHGVKRDKCQGKMNRENKENVRKKKKVLKTVRQLNQLRKNIVPLGLNASNSKSTTLGKLR